MSLRSKRIAEKLLACKAKEICKRDRILSDLLAAKAAGIAQREQMASAYIAVRVANFNRRMDTVNEQYRAAHELPLCPPDCSRTPLTLENE